MRQKRQPSTAESYDSEDYESNDIPTSSTGSSAFKKVKQYTEHNLYLTHPPLAAEIAKVPRGSSTRAIKRKGWAEFSAMITTAVCYVGVTYAAWPLDGRTHPHTHTHQDQDQDQDQANDNGAPAPPAPPTRKRRKLTDANSRQTDLKQFFGHGNVWGAPDDNG